ncbi:MAG: carboxypeptidase-like regulatory domain-containing protein [Candidatus Cloacimonetes bacterium]|nr:carboxypeptidase-like regulatory domain-containing protein [Candidatus Cloacimonadota bacterium]
MKNISWILMAMALVFIFTGCGDTTTNFDDDNLNNGRVIGTIHGIVTDGADNERLENVEVTWVVDGVLKSTTTDALGYYSIMNLNSGNYEITFYQNTTSRAGYAVSHVLMVIPDLDAIGIVDIATGDDFHYSETHNVNMFALNAGVTGSVNATVNNVLIPDLVDVTVIADFIGWGVSPNEYVTTTDADGVYSFAGIPSTGTVQIRIDSFSDGTYVYGSDQRVVDLIPGLVVNEPAFYMTPAAENLVIVAHNLVPNFPVDSNLELTLNRPVIAEETEITLSRPAAPDVYLSSINWTSDCHVVIDPSVILQLNAVYILTINGTTVNGNAFTVAMNIQTQNGIEVESTNIEQYDGYAEIAPNGTIIINFTEAVNVTALQNLINLAGDPAPSTIWSNSNKTLTLPAPVGGYTTANINLAFTYYSVLAPNDNVQEVYNINITQ